MPVVTKTPYLPGFEIKSSQLPVLVLQLKTADLGQLSEEFAERFGHMPDFFDQDGVVLDLSRLRQDALAAGARTLETPADFLALRAVLHQHRLRPLAVRGGSPGQIAAALAAGLVVAPGLPEAQSRMAGVSAPAAPPKPVPPPVFPASALIIDKPLRCGQQVYARGRDLVVLAMVNAGAEIIADGHIHVYAPLRGRAIAGAQGNGDARIFALAMASELICIAGIYSTGDAPMHQAAFGKAAQASLLPGPQGERLVLDVMHA